jgi:hydrogenase nickel incorporation protein HypA/HybF
MHEMAIAMELMEQLERIADENELVRIESVKVCAGALRGIVPEAMETAFVAASLGTRMAGAELDLEIVPARAACRLCGKSFEPDIACYLCPDCGQADVDLVEGNDIVLASITGESESEVLPHEDQRRH